VWEEFGGAQAALSGHALASRVVLSKARIVTISIPVRSTNSAAIVWGCIAPWMAYFMLEGIVPGSIRHSVNALFCLMCFPPFESFVMTRNVGVAQGPSSTARIRGRKEDCADEGTRPETWEGGRGRKHDGVLLDLTSKEC
jgi:hypothetical protein